MSFLSNYVYGSKSLKSSSNFAEGKLPRGSSYDEEFNSLSISEPIRVR